MAIRKANLLSDSKLTILSTPAKALEVSLGYSRKDSLGDLRKVSLGGSLEDSLVT